MASCGLDRICKLKIHGSGWRCLYLVSASSPAVDWKQLKLQSHTVTSTKTNMVVADPVGFSSTIAVGVWLTSAIALRISGKNDLRVLLAVRWGGRWKRWSCCMEEERVLHYQMTYIIYDMWLFAYWSTRWCLEFEFRGHVMDFRYRSVANLFWTVYLHNIAWHDGMTIHDDSPLPAGIHFDVGITVTFDSGGSWFVSQLAVYLCSRWTRWQWFPKAKGLNSWWVLAQFQNSLAYQTLQVDTPGELGFWGMKIIKAFGVCTTWSYRRPGPSVESPVSKTGLSSIVILDSLSFCSVGESNLMPSEEQEDRQLVQNCFLYLHKILSISFGSTSKISEPQWLKKTFKQYHNKPKTVSYSEVCQKLP